MRCSRGDVVLVLFPDSSLITAKRRPALVVPADELHTGLPQTVVAMITSNIARAGHPSRVLVQRHSAAGTAMGLLSDSSTVRLTVLGFVSSDEIVKTYSTK